MAQQTELRELDVDETKELLSSVLSLLPFALIYPFTNSKMAAPEQIARAAAFLACALFETGYRISGPDHPPESLATRLPS